MRLPLEIQFFGHSVNLNSAFFLSDAKEMQQIKHKILSLISQRALNFFFLSKNQIYILTQQYTHFRERLLFISNL